MFRFIVNMDFAFQERDKLFLAIDFVPGGDLRFQLTRRKRFTETETSNLAFKFH